MKLFGKYYYVMQAVLGALLTIGAMAQAIRGMFNETPAFVNVILVAIAIIAYCLLYLPSMREYKKYKYIIKKQTEQNG